MWPQTHVSKRIAAMEEFLKGLQTVREEIIKLLMWEICKTQDDAAKEVDRTIAYIKDTIVGSSLCCGVWVGELIELVVGGYVVVYSSTNTLQRSSTFNFVVVVVVAMSVLCECSSRKFHVYTSMNLV